MDLQPRLQQPDSGLYALVTNSDNRELWRSPSLAMAGEALAGQIMQVAAVTKASPVGRFDFVQSVSAAELYCLSNRVDWEGLSDSQVTFNLRRPAALRQCGRAISIRFDGGFWIAVSVVKCRHDLGTALGAPAIAPHSITVERTDNGNRSEPIRFSQWS